MNNKIIILVIIVLLGAFGLSYSRNKPEQRQDEEKVETVSEISENADKEKIEIVSEVSENAKVYLKYESFDDGKYRIYRLNNKYFLCHGKKILDSTLVEEDLKATHYKKSSLWPYAYSKEHSLYIIQAELNKKHPKLEFIKVAENCKDTNHFGHSHKNNRKNFFPIYKKDKKFFIVIPISKKFKSIELSPDTIAIDLNLTSNNMWNIRLFIPDYNICLGIIEYGHTFFDNWEEGEISQYISENMENILKDIIS